MLNNKLQTVPSIRAAAELKSKNPSSATYSQATEQDYSSLPKLNDATFRTASKRTKEPPPRELSFLDPPPAPKLPRVRKVCGGGATAMVNNGGLTSHIPPLTPKARRDATS
jgi:hypothetical protein